MWQRIPCLLACPEAKNNASTCDRMHKTLGHKTSWISYCYSQPGTLLTMKLDLGPAAMVGRPGRALPLFASGAAQ